MTHYLIYKITNNLNGKIYIGKHKTDNLDDGYMGSGLNIGRAIKKYGVENFTKEILYEVDDEELMDFVEEVIVDEAFVAREDTYNIALGGQGGHILNNFHHSEETRKKISEARKGKHYGYSRHHSEETRRKMSESLRGRTSPTKGKHLSEETKTKISQTRLERKVPSPRLGKHLSEETKMKISESLKAKPDRTDEYRKKMSEVKTGCRWYNNGIKETCSKECPEGWTQGRLRKENINEVA